MTETDAVPAAALITAAPTNYADRLHSLDYVRGIAVMGIVFANVIGFGQTTTAYVWPGAFIGDDGDPGGWLWVAQFVAIDGKFRGLFTLLFGAGLMLFMQKAWARGATRWLQLRRLAILLAFGLAHFYLLWRGDILVGYALSGAVACLFMTIRAQGQLILGLLGFGACALLFASITIPAALIASTDPARTPALSEMHEDLLRQKAETMAEDQREIALIEAGDHAAYVANNWREHRFEPFTNTMLFIFETLPLMLIGMALYRLGLFEGRIAADRLRRLGWIGVAIGGGLALAVALWVRSDGFTFYGTYAAIVGLLPIPQLLTTLGLLALLIHYAPPASGWWGARVTAAGRAAFTNYIGTSVVMVAVFHGWGGGLFGKLDRPQLYAVALAVCVVMLLWSEPWLRRFRHGPLEWLWRCLTYGRLFAIRR